MDTLIFYGYEFGVSFLPFCTAFFCFRRLENKTFCKQDLNTGRGRQTVPAFLIIILFALYIISVYHFTGAGTLYDGLLYQLEMRPEQINLIPFSNTIDIISYLLNILLFVPFGIFLPLLTRGQSRLICSAGGGFVFSLLIEASQLLNNRRSDIDDLILNTLGAAAGFALFKFFSARIKRMPAAGAVRGFELWAYIFIMFAGRFLLYNEFGLAKLLYGF